VLCKIGPYLRIKNVITSSDISKMNLPDAFGTQIAKPLHYNEYHKFVENLTLFSYIHFIANVICPHQLAPLSNYRDLSVY
jgi:hypothetical protein